MHGHLHHWNLADIDECANGTDLCEYTPTCVNTIGSYNCSCISDNEVLALDEHRCLGENQYSAVKINECYYAACKFIISNECMLLRPIGTWNCWHNVCDVYKHIHDTIFFWGWASQTCISIIIHDTFFVLALALYMTCISIYMTDSFSEDGL